MEINVQSDVGRKRNTNQDYANVFENQQHITFAVLADGMGGHQAGDVASQMAVNNLGESWSNASVDSAEKSAQWLIQAIQKENGCKSSTKKCPNTFFGNAWHCRSRCNQS